MKTQEIIKHLERQRLSLDQAIAALNGGRPKIRRKGRKTMSAAARKRISAAQKKRWAERKKATAKA